MNNISQKYAVFFVPFFNLPNHVGNYRIKRFINWLGDIGYKVIVFSSGYPKAEKFSWGANYVIQNKVSIYLHKLLKIRAKFYPAKVLYRLIKILFEIFLIPDEEILWVNAVIKNDTVLDLVKDASFILSSSPLESAHIASYKLAKKNRIPYIVDLRDGWFDEPLKKVLQKKSKRYYRELRLEAKLLHNSNLIIVTSEEWKKLLINRYPSLDEKTYILYNGYPDFNTKEINEKTNSNNIELIYSGRFRGSSFRRTPDMMFNQLSKYIYEQKLNVNIELFGEFIRDDVKELSVWVKKFNQISCKLKISNSVPRDELFQKFGKKDAFLLLSISKAAIPSKLFEYLLFNKPILAFAPSDSPIGRLSETIFHLVLIDPENSYYSNKSNFRKFFDLVNHQENQFKIPEEFSEKELRKSFFKIIKNIDK